MSFWKPILAALVIFVAGFVSGRLTLQLCEPALTPESPPREPSRRGPWPSGPRENMFQDMAGRLAEELSLTDGQRQQAETIIRTTHERVRSMVDGFNPKVWEAFRNMEAQLREIMNPEQQTLYDKKMEERRESWKRRREGRGGGPGPRDRRPPPPDQKPPREAPQPSDSTMGSDPL